MEYMIKNGFVYCPLNGVDGEKMDICVKDSKIVERSVTVPRSLMHPGKL